MSSPSSSPELAPAMGPDIMPDFSYKDATHDEVLEDLSSRFILNLPDDELSSLERISFQVEQAHWFYEDFIREQNHKLPSLSLKKFSAMLFKACPLLHHWSDDHEQAFNTFMQYKTRVPVCGAIMLNDTWEKCVLVKGWKASSGWGFPKGKINEQEPRHTCAVREVLEETGYNLAGKVNPEHVIEMTIKEQRIAMFIVPNIPEDYPFKTKTRKEISKIEWFRLADLPTWKKNQASPGKFYLISPFIAPLKAFIQAHRPRRQKLKATSSFVAPIPEADESNQESSSQASSADNGGPSTPSPQSSSADRVVHQQDTMSGIDPHFARLLSSLTTSAAPKEKEPVVVEAPPAESSSPETSPEAQPALQATSVPTPPPQRLNSPPTATMITPRTRTKHFTPPQALSVPSEQPSQVSTNGSSASAVSPSPTSAQSLTVPRPPSSRRTSSVADISPYLRKQGPAQTTPAHLRRLALLEGIANESARMTPRIDEEEKRLSSPSPFPSAPSGFVFPPSQQSQPLPNADLLYSSNASGRQSVAEVMRPHAAPSTFQSDPFQVRSRTSMGMHRPLHGMPNSASMNSNQLLSMMQGAGPSYMPPPPPPPPHMAPLNGPYARPPFPGPPPPPPAPGYLAYGPPPPMPPAGYGLPPPGYGVAPPPAMPPYSPMVPTAKAGPVTGTLLSILTGKSAPNT